MSWGKRIRKDTDGLLLIHEFLTSIYSFANSEKRDDTLDLPPLNSDIHLDIALLLRRTATSSACFFVHTAWHGVACMKGTNTEAQMESGLQYKKRSRFPVNLAVKQWKAALGSPSSRVSQLQGPLLTNRHFALTLDVSSR